MTAELFGLRERKKQQTRNAIADAAMRLTIERGYDHVTVDDIAAAADVSPRTFSNYFPSKDSAVLASLRNLGEQLCSEFIERPADEAVWESLRAAVLVALVPVDEAGRGIVQAFKAIFSSAALRAQQACVDDELSERIAREVARRTGTVIGQDLYPRLVAGAVFSVLHTAITHWLNAEPPARLVDIVNVAFDQTIAGLQSPHLTRPNVTRMEHS